MCVCALPKVLCSPKVFFYFPFLSGSLSFPYSPFILNLADLFISSALILIPTIAIATAFPVFPNKPSRAAAASERTTTKGHNMFVCDFRGLAADTDLSRFRRAVVGHRQRKGAPQKCGSFQNRRESCLPLCGCGINSHDDFSCVSDCKATK